MRLKNNSSFPKTNPLPKLLLSIGYLFTQGCALQDGQPWGELEASLSQNFIIPEDRKIAENRFQTSGDFEIQLEQFALSLDAISIQLSGSGTSNNQFDPADPPEGYSLCHNGHCHADDGRLVDYEDIEIELLGQDGSSGNQLFLTPTENEVQIIEGRQNIALSECENNCWIPRGTIGSVSLVIPSIQLKAHIRDTREGELKRLPEEGINLDLEFPVSIEVQARVDKRVKRGKPVMIKLPIVFQLSSRVFDQVSWDSLYDPENLQLPVTKAPQEFQDQIKQRLETVSELIVQ